MEFLYVVGAFSDWILETISDNDVSSNITGKMVRRSKCLEYCESMHWDNEKMHSKTPEHSEKEQVKMVKQHL